MLKLFAYLTTFDLMFLKLQSCLTMVRCSSEAPGGVQNHKWVVPVPT